MDPEVLGLLLKESIADKKRNTSNPFVNIWRRHFQFRTEIVWFNVFVMALLHISAVYGFYLLFTGHVRLLSFTFMMGYAYMGSVGVTGGAHRLWSHRSYKATWQMRLILVIFNSMVFQNCIHEWVRDHRLHHKHTETDADPHSYARGFFFAHMGWLLVKKHPDVKAKGKNIDLSDLEADEIVMFQKRNYYWMMPFFTFALPALLSYYVFGESLAVSWHLGAIGRYLLSVHGAWCVNSFAHYSGHKPYDKTIAATNNTYVSVIAMGEGWHNYHHVFPWDYKTSELGFYSMNWTLAFINFFAKIGWAYDLKTVSETMIKARSERTGDGLPYKYTKIAVPKDQSNVKADHHHSHENSVWGWTDKAMDRFDRENALILNREKTR